VVRLSVLDQSPISEGSTGSFALRNTIDLARLCDELGYHRYWVAEHHATPMLAGASPEALIGPIAEATSRIRVGSGGVMLPHYSALKVAENFSVLSGLFPGRIDLGVGRAPGSDRATMVALQRDKRLPLPDDFPDQLVELLTYLEHGLPGQSERPDLWLLGSSPQSALWARELELRYAFADFINPNGAAFAAPAAAVALSVICAETDEEAARVASSSRMVFTLFRTGRLIAVPPIDKALRFLEVAELPPPERRVIVGSPETVRAGIEEVTRAYGAEEAIVVTITYDHEARRRSYELLAETFKLRA
jgi:luciferase family oxidoreductase group 1